MEVYNESEEVLYSVLMSEEELRVFSDLLQREFGIGSDLLHSGVKRTYQKYGGRARNKIANHFVKAARESSAKTGQAQYNYMTAPTIQNPKLTKSLMKKGRSLDTRVIGNDQGGSWNLKAEVIRNTPKQEMVSRLRGDIRKSEKVLNEGRKGRDVVLYDRTTGAELLAHELGHSHNSRQKGLKKLLQKVGTNPNYRGKLNDTGNFLEDISGTKSVGGILKDYVKGKAAVLEESRATKKGLKMLKEAGASKEELDIARNHMGKNGGLGTYTHATNVLNKLGIANKIQIPSRRGRGAVENGKSVLNKFGII